MTALNPPRDSFDPELLAAMEQAFDATWAFIQTREPSLDKERVNALSLNYRLNDFCRESLVDENWSTSQMRAKLEFIQLNSGVLVQRGS